MIKAVKSKDNTICQYQWVTDNTECDQQVMPPARGFLVEVTGDLNGEPVTLHGGLVTTDAVLEVIRSTPTIVQIPAVRILRPVAPAGITITVQGVL